MRRFHNLVRGLVYENGHVLVARAKGASNTFLPGGHIEVGESAPTALTRELREEIGFDSKIGRFLGCIEHRWDENGHENYEINHIFRLHVAGLKPVDQPKSLEEHIELFWLSVFDLAKYNLQPAPLVDLINGIPISLQNAWWASTLSDA